jgi:hypothetical protein
LVDDLSAIEHDHRDALRPIQCESTESFMGDHVLTQPVTAIETRELKMSIDRSINEAISRICAEVRSQTSGLPGLGAPNLNLDDSNTICSSVAQNVGPLNSVLNLGPDIRHQVGIPKKPHCPRTAPIPSVSIPNLPKTGETAWKLAVKQWEEVDAQTGFALKDWPEEWYTGKMREAFAAKRGTRRMIALEYRQ